jgi:hypothetical protein
MSMIRTSIIRHLGIISLIGGAATAYAQHEHEGDFVVGRTGEGQLAAEFDAGAPFELSPISGLLEGWRADEPGFMALQKDEPKEDFFRLESGANIVFELVSIDPALQVWTPGFGAVLNDPGESWKIGGFDFDEHPVWHINSSDPSFHALNAPWELTFRLTDVGGTGYTSSEDYSISFVAVPEPGTLVIMVCAACGVLFCRDRHSGRQGEASRGRSQLHDALRRGTK